ncbi:MAG: hypothetical protein KTR27_09630 [Leptolyngbyaceae cyanobacterium MAG.088]|nr:hypothetical protein [Leptolyngbyaceae cyanobacterium MAG.088]
MKIAQTKAETPVDIWVKNSLDAFDLTHKFLEDGIFEIVATLDGNRSQRIFINSKTAKFGDMEIWDIYS